MNVKLTVSLLPLLALGLAMGAAAQDAGGTAGYDSNPSGSLPPAALVDCAPGDVCGLLGPHPETHWIADGEWEPTLDLMGFITVDQTSSRIVIIDPNSCGEVFSLSPAFTTSYRGFAWGLQGGDMWVTGWNAPVLLFHLDPTGGITDQFDLGIEIASLAMDYANGHLWAMQRSPAGVNSALLEFDVNSGAPVLLQGPITVDWGGSTPGGGSAGLEYDNSNCSIVALRQDSNNVGQSSIEVFWDLDPGGPGGIFWVANCDIVTTLFCTGAGTFINHPWGLALNENAAPDRKIVVTDIDLDPGCAIPAPGAAPVDLHYYSVPPSVAFCAATAVEPSTWGQIKTLHTDR